MFEDFKLKKTVLSGLAYYIPTLLVGMIAMRFFLSAMSYIWWVASAIFMLISMKYIYKPTNGLEMGIVFFLTTLIIEIPLFVFGMGMGFGLYLNWTVWVQYLLTILVPVIGIKYLK